MHGMGSEPAEADWPALGPAELEMLLSGYPEAQGLSELEWHSPRPLSAAALVRTSAGTRLFVKRHHVSVRDTASLEEEHRFLAHLVAHGAPVVRVLADARGRTVAVGGDRGEWTYEVHTVGEGDDVYRDAISWSPFLSPAHARSAGRTLATLHAAAAGYDAPERRPAPLIGGFTIFGDRIDPIAAAGRYLELRPALAAEMRRWPDWPEQLRHLHSPFWKRLQPFLEELEPLWTHNDLHASNLLWRGDEAATVIDFNLADRAFAVHDLALAIERNAVEWVRLSESGEAAVHADAAVALIKGYEEVRKLTDAERAALPELLPLCHADFALSELDYFAGVTRSAANAELAYRYLVDHTAWFATEAGNALLEHIRSTLGR